MNNWGIEYIKKKINNWGINFEYSWLCSCKGCKFLRFIKVK